MAQTPGQSLRLVYMGTPEFAVPALEALAEGGYQVVAVVTAPDKPAGRGMKLTPSPVKECALRHGIPVLQPEKLRSPQFLEELAALQADLQVVVAFRMLPEAVWRMPRLGTFNLHASLLPQYRGAAPINWAIVNGEEKTGLTTFFLQQEIDTGDIILQEETPIGPEETVGELYGRLMRQGPALVVRTIEAVATGQYTLRRQALEGPAKPAPKIDKETCRIDFEAGAEAVCRLVRGMSPYPAAWTLLDGQPLKVFRAVPGQGQYAGGEAPYWTDGRQALHFRAADGFVAVLDLQLAGKKRMGVEEFLRGHRFTTQ